MYRRGRRRPVGRPERNGFTGVGLVVGVAESCAPMAKVGADDEDRGRITKVWGKDAAVGLLTCGGGVTNEDGNQGWKVFGVVGEFALLLSIHDSFKIRCHPSRVENVIRTVKAFCECMADAFLYCVLPRPQMETFGRTCLFREARQWYEDRG